jgi:hypothetical protein
MTISVITDLDSVTRLGSKVCMGSIGFAGFTGVLARGFF